MHDRIAMTVYQCTPDLTRKLSCRPLPKPTVADDIIEHLTAIDKLEDHIIVVGVNDHFAHPADVGMMQE